MEEYTNPPVFLGSPGTCSRNVYQALSPPEFKGPGYEASSGCAMFGYAICLVLQLRRWFYRKFWSGTPHTNRKKGHDWSCMVVYAAIYYNKSRNQEARKARSSDQGSFKGWIKCLIMIKIIDHRCRWKYRVHRGDCPLFGRLSCSLWQLVGSPLILVTIY